MAGPPPPPVIGIQRLFVRPPWEGIEGNLMLGATAPTNGQWCGLMSYYPLTVTVEGTWTGQINLSVSCNPQQPDEGIALTHFPMLGDPGGIVAPLIVEISSPYNWIRAWSPNLSGAGAEGVNVYCVAARPLGLRAF